MNKYELAVVVSAKLEDEARADVIEKVKKDFTTSSTSRLKVQFQLRWSSVSALWTMYSDIYA